MYFTQFFPLQNDFLRGLRGGNAVEETAEGCSLPSAESLAESLARRDEALDTPEEEDEAVDGDLAEVGGVGTRSLGMAPGPESVEEDDGLEGVFKAESILLEPPDVENGAVATAGCGIRCGCGCCGCGCGRSRFCSRC